MPIILLVKKVLTTRKIRNTILSLFDIIYIDDHRLNVQSKIKFASLYVALVMGALYFLSMITYAVQFQQAFHLLCWVFTMFCLWADEKEETK